MFRWRVPKGIGRFDADFARGGSGRAAEEVSSVHGVDPLTRRRQCWPAAYSPPTSDPAPVLLQRRPLLAIFIPDDLPLRIPVPDVRDQDAGLPGIAAGRIDPHLMRRRQTRRLVVPAQLLAADVVDAIALRRAVETDRAGPPRAADRAVNVLVDALLEHVFVLVRVTRHHVRLVAFEQAIDRETVGHHLTDIRRRLLQSPMLRAQERDVREDDDRASAFDLREVGLQPLQLTLVDVSDVPDPCHITSSNTT